MSLFTHYRLYPQLSLCTALLLILGFLGAGFYLYNSNKSQQVQIEQYGRLLATSAARQAVDATLTQDLISLQTILQDVAQYPNVVGATLRNVENKLLVQSGYKPKQAAKGKRYNFTAPIALHNNVAGYLDVAIEVPRRSTQDDLFLICWAISVALALFIIWWSIHRAWWLSLRDKLPTANAIVTAVVDKLPTIADADLQSESKDTNLPAPAQLAVRLTIQIVNLNKLYLQLNSESFDIVLSRFEAQMQKLLNVYNGQRQLLVGDTLMIDFMGEEFHECSFRAICCAKMLLNMAARNPSPRLQLAATIQPHAIVDKAAGKSLINDFIVQQNNALTPIKNEILISPSLLDSNVQEQAEFDIAQGKLMTIKAPYCDYIAKQEEQLFPR